ncbi:mCG1036109 [Mus musculus]|nr:mCG1036109 [Mus musculus]
MNIKENTRRFCPPRPAPQGWMRLHQFTLTTAL